MATKRIKFLIYHISMIVLSTIFGLGSRKFPDLFSPFLAEYLGDTMWTLFFYAFFRIVFYKMTSFKIFVITYIFSVFIELSQLIKTDFLNQIRQTFLGGLILGFGFLWSDLICYLIGALIGLLLEKLIFEKFISNH